MTLVIPHLLMTLVIPHLLMSIMDQVTSLEISLGAMPMARMGVNSVERGEQEEGATSRVAARSAAVHFTGVWRGDRFQPGAQYLLLLPLFAPAHNGFAHNPMSSGGRMSGSSSGS